MKILVDTENNRPTESGWTHCTSVNEAITLMQYNPVEGVKEIQVAPSLGVNSYYGGDTPVLFRWLAENDYWPEAITLRGKPENFRNLPALIRDLGNYTRKRGVNTWVK